MQIREEQTDLSIASRDFVTASQVNQYYSGDGGNDANDGKSIQTRTESIDQAVFLAKNQPSTPTSTNRISINNVGGGSFKAFNLNGPYISVNAVDAGFYFPFTASSPDGIIINAGSSADLGFISTDNALTTQAGILLKTTGGTTAVRIHASSLFSGDGVYGNTLFQANSETVIFDCDDIRQGGNINYKAVEVLDNVTCYIKECKRLRGKVSVGDGAVANIEAQEFSGDVVVGSNSILWMHGYVWGTGDIISVGTNSFIVMDFAV